MYFTIFKLWSAKDKPLYNVFLIVTIREKKHLDHGKANMYHGQIKAWAELLISLQIKLY